MLLGTCLAIQAAWLCAAARAALLEPFPPLSLTNRLPALNTTYPLTQPNYQFPEPQIHAIRFDGHTLEASFHNYGHHIPSAPAFECLSKVLDAIESHSSALNYPIGQDALVYNNTTPDAVANAIFTIYPSPAMTWFMLFQLTESFQDFPLLPHHYPFEGLPGSRFEVDITGVQGRLATGNFTGLPNRGTARGGWLRGQKTSTQ